MSYISLSRIEKFTKCPYSFKLAYLDKLKRLPSQDPQSACLIGSALHYGCETRDVKKAIDMYYNNYYVIDNLQVHEAMKLETLIPKVWEVIDSLGYEPDNMINEIEFDIDGFKGIIDLLCKNEEDGTVDIYDFKYSNNINYYLQSAQLHLYRYYIEQIGYKVNKMGFIFIPKTMIRKKKTESIEEFRMRLKHTLNNMYPIIEYIEYDPLKVADALKSAIKLYNTNEFEKTPSNLCKWCDFKEYCQEGVDCMMELPVNERRIITIDRKPDMWIYGGSYTGKTTFADQFDNNLMFNTDGNVDMITNPVIRIKDVIEKTGRTVNKTWAWEVFKQYLDKLESEKTTFEIITVDLVEDMWEHCRLYMYDKQGWEHEQDGGYGKGYDMIQLEFLSTMKRLKNIGYRIILISKLKLGEVTRGSNKITTYTPNINPKLAEVIAGIVDMTVLVEADGDTRTMNFKSSPYIFGGSRFNFGVEKIELSPKALDEAITNSSINVNYDSERVQKLEPVIESCPKVSSEETESQHEETKRRTRRRKVDN